MRRHSFSAAMAARQRKNQRPERSAAPTMKRPAAAPTTEARQAKKPAPDPEEKMFALIIGAISGAEGLSESMKGMLSSFVKTCLGVDKDERHPFQASAVEEIGDVLVAIKAKLETAAEEARGEFDHVVATKATRESTAVETLAALGQCEDVVSAKKLALGRACEELEEATDALEAAKRAQGITCATEKETLRGHSSLSAMLTDQLLPLKQAAASGAEIKAFMAKCQEFAFDQSLLAMAPSALKKAPAERGEFEKLALIHLETDLAKRIDEASKTLACLAQAVAERAAIVSAAMAAQETAMESLQECETELDGAKAGHKDCVSALKLAKDLVERYFSDMKASADAFDFAKLAAADFRTGPFSAFEELKSRQTTSSVLPCLDIQLEAKTVGCESGKKPTWAGA